MRNLLKLPKAVKCQDNLQLNLVLLTSGKFFLLCYWAKVIPVQWLSWKLSCTKKMTLLANLVIELKCQNDDHLPFGILETTVKKLSSKPCRLFAAILWMHMAFQSRAMSHWNVNYVTAETSPGNYVRHTVRTSLYNEKCLKPTLSLLFLEEKPTVRK